MSDERETREIRTDYLARVEGEGAMLVRLRGDEVEEVQFKIFEPPRFFEALLRGRQFTEAPDITARICGICPIAYIASACNAMEAVCGIELPEQVRLLRRLIYCGEWIESHVLHTAMLHAPDFLGYDGAIELARDRRDLVETALRLKKAGNELMRVVGGREVHPINLRVGGMYRAPSRAELEALVPELEWARDAAVEFTRFVAGFDFPDFEQDYAFVALRQPGEYAIERGRIVTSTGLDIAVSEYEQHFTETHVERSNALHSTLAGVGNYLVGPLARYALNQQELSPLARELAAEVGLGEVVPQPVPQHRRARRRDGLRGGRGPSHHRAVRAARPARRGGDPAGGHGPRLQRGPARDLLAPLRDRRRRHHPRREDRAADLAEPEDDRGGPGRRREAVPAPPGRRAGAPLRADDPQLRPLHLLRDALPQARGRARVRAAACLGSRYRGDDAVGPLVADRLRSAGAEVLDCDDEPTRLLDAWAGLDLRRDRGRGVVGCRRHRARGHGAPLRRRGRPAAP